MCVCVCVCACVDTIHIFLFQMPLVRRPIAVRPPVPHLYSKCAPKEVLAGVSMSHMLGLLEQLTQLSEYATEVFEGLLDTATGTSQRVTKIADRVSAMEAIVPIVEVCELSLGFKFWINMPTCVLCARIDLKTCRRCVLGSDLHRMRWPPCHRKSYTTMIRVLVTSVTTCP